MQRGGPSAIQIRLRHRRLAVRSCWNGICCCYNDSAPTNPPSDLHTHSSPHEMNCFLSALASGVRQHYQQQLPLQLPQNPLSAGPVRYQRQPTIAWIDLLTLSELSLAPLLREPHPRSSYPPSRPALPRCLSVRRITQRRTPQCGQCHEDSARRRRRRRCAPGTAAADAAAAAVRARSASTMPMDAK